MDAADWAELTGQPAPPLQVEPETERVFIVWAPLWDVFMLFCASERLWRYPAMGGPAIGLDLVQVRCLAEARGMPWNGETVGLIQAMEAEAARVWVEEWKRTHPDKGGK